MAVKRPFRLPFAFDRLPFPFGSLPGTADGGGVQQALARRIQTAAIGALTGTSLPIALSAYSCALRSATGQKKWKKLLATVSSQTADQNKHHHININFMNNKHVWVRLYVFGIDIG